MKDYFTIKKEIKNEIVIKKSVFISQIDFINNEKDAQIILEAVKKEHYKATHYCYAYILGENKSIIKYSDGGEPSATAGRPILSVLQHHDLTNIIAVVSRYFGGIKLGASGLARAYGQSITAALKKAQIIHKQVCDIITFKTDYNFHGKMKAYFSAGNYSEKESIFSDEVVLSVCVPILKSRAIIADIFELSNGACEGTITDRAYRDIEMKEGINV